VWTIESAELTSQPNTRRTSTNREGTAMSNPRNSNLPSDLDVALAVFAAIKSRLPAEEFEVHDGTLFLSSERGSPRAVFAVSLTGIKYGLIPVNFEIPRSVEALADELVGQLLVTRAEWNSDAGGASTPIGVPESSDATQPAAEDRGQTNQDGENLVGSSSSQESKQLGNSPVTLGRSGLWLVTTNSGARLVVVVVVDPTSKNPIVTLTRYAEVGHGDGFNGAPLTVEAPEPPEVGRRWYATVIATDAKYIANDEIVYGGFNAVYLSTPVATIKELTYEMLVAAGNT
jgi:hypothetical protein